MIRIIGFVCLLVLQGSAFAEEADKFPEWVNSPTQGAASACSSMSHGEAVALRIAIAKAKANLARERESTVHSEQVLERESNGAATKAAFKETTSISSEDHFDKIAVVEKVISSINGVEQLCVMITRETDGILLGARN